MIYQPRFIDMTGQRFGRWKVSSQRRRRQWLHWHINKMKGTFDQAEFIELCRRVADSNPILGETPAPKSSERITSPI